MKNIAFILFILSFLYSCGTGSSSQNQGQKIEEMCSIMLEKYPFSSELNEILLTMSGEKKEAMEFMIATSLPNDLEQGAELYPSAIDATFDAKEYFQWGTSIPKDIFMHYVLPLRVNNETLDGARVFFYNAVKDRIKGMSMHDAALEVNYYCQEVMTYAPSDARTSSPLASVQTATGRCGEESVLSVAALRAAGIPARQIYSPRWAHSDDNHAWVEVWIDGQWNYLGACEPEYRLNKGWFDDVARRALLMHTKVIGDFSGGNEVISGDGQYTEINVTDNYVDVKPLEVKVMDSEGADAKEADVTYTIYNYAQMFPVASRQVEGGSVATLNAGHGNMPVWATDGEYFGFEVGDNRLGDTLAIAMVYQYGDIFSEDLDITPPAENPVNAEEDQEAMKRNSERLTAGSKMRNDYIATFYTKEKSDALATAIGVDKETLWKIMESSKGNYAQIEWFLKNADNVSMAMDMLSVISKKDIYDIKGELLLDHMNSVAKYSDKYDKETFNRNILSPRVALEHITPYASYFSGELSGKSIEDIKNFKLFKTESTTPLRMVMPPMVTYRSPEADEQSKKVLFVSMARSIGTPARIDRASNQAQYLDGDNWVYFSVDPSFTFDEYSPKGEVVITYGDKNIKYYTNYTISKIGSDLKPELTNLSSGEYDMGAGGALKSVKLDTGYYMITSGNRLPSGKVLARVSTFKVEKDKQTKVDISLRQESNDIEVIGKIDGNTAVTKDGKDVSINSLAKNGYYLLALMNGSEPSRHLAGNINKITEELNSWGQPFIVVSPKGEDAHFTELLYGVKNIIYTSDDSGEVTALATSLGKRVGNLPLVVIANTKGEVIYCSAGYNISLGAHITSTIEKLK